MSQVVVLNASYEQLHLVSVKHAMKMIVRGVAVIEEAHPDETFGPFPKPLVLRLVRYVKMSWKYMTTTKAAYSKALVIKRDRGRCAYCGKTGADTMDHVMPRSRGGASCWLNAVAAHAKCNRVKGARTPEEAGMPLLWQPFEPSRVDLLF